MSAATFEYRAVDGAGAKRSGTVQGATEHEAFRQLTAMGLTPLSLRAAAGSPGRARSRRVSLRQVAQLTGQLSVLVGARMSISEGLHAIAEQEPDAKLKAIVKDIASRVASGEAIADALGNHPGAFSEVYVQTVRAAEQSGTLTRALEFLAEMLERQEESRRQVKGALMYPMCVVAALSAAVIFLLTFVVPKFGKMFAERGVELPLLTRCLQAFGESVQGYWFVYLPALIGAAFGLRMAWRSKGGRTAIDGLLHRVPYMRAILVGLALQRFAQVLGVSIGSGLGLIESLELAGRSAARPMLTADVERLTAQVRAGGRLSNTLPECTYLTPFTKRMIGAGETSAELPKMCAVVARHYERETAHLTKNISTVIEPVLVVLIAGVVMVIALAIFLPMWDMVKLMG